MADTELKVILKAKELAEHTLRITSNCNRYPNLKKYQLVTEKNIADIVAICVNTQEDIKSFIVLDVVDLI